MDPQPISQQASSDPSPPTRDAIAIWGRPLAVATAVAFVISTAFPVVAGLSRDTASFPNWWGVLDVGIAFVLAFLAIGLSALAQGHVDKQAEDATYRAYRVLIHGILALLVVFFLFGDRISWVYCLTGLAWRTWLLLYLLPAWIVGIGATAVSRSGAPTSRRAWIGPPPAVTRRQRPHPSASKGVLGEGQVHDEQPEVGSGTE